MQSNYFRLFQNTFVRICLEINFNKNIFGGKHQNSEQLSTEDK